MLPLTKIMPFAFMACEKMGRGAGALEVRIGIMEAIFKTIA